MSEARFLLDTNILVYLIGGSSPTLRGHVERHEPGSVVTSSLCVAEALFGVRRPDQRLALDRLLEAIEPRAFDMAAARVFPRIPFHRGRLDRLIAAHALSLNLILVTNNERDFSDVPDLAIENWTQ